MAARGPSGADQLLEIFGTPFEATTQAVGSARAVFAALYPDIAAKVDATKLHDAVAAWLADNGKWSAMRKAIACFEDNAPSEESIKRMWRLDPRSGDVRPGKKGGGENLIHLPRRIGAWLTPSMSEPAETPVPSPVPTARDLRRISVIADVTPDTARAAYVDPAHVQATTHARVEVAARALCLPLPPARPVR